MIPIKNPDISTNRYKKLLWFEKQYHKKCEEITNLRIENRNLQKEKKELKDSVELIKEEIEMLNNADFDTVNLVTFHSIVEKIVNKALGSDK